MSPDSSNSRELESTDAALARSPSQETLTVQIMPEKGQIRIPTEGSHESPLGRAILALSSMSQDLQMANGPVAASGVETQQRHQVSPLFAAIFYGARFNQT